MKNSRDKGFDQYYNAQMVVEQKSLLILATTLSNHPNDQKEALPTIDAISPLLGKPKAAALDNGYFSSTNIVGLHNREIVPYIATGRQSHYSTLPVLLPQHLVVPIQADTDKVKMAYTLRTEVGKEIYRLRKCTVEPVIGVIKEAIGFRQFSLRGLQKADGEWCLVCLAFNLRRLQVLLGNASASSPTTC